MNKRLLVLFFILCLFISGCTSSRNPVSPETSVETNDSASTMTEISSEGATTDPLLEEYLSNLNVLETPIHQYGESTGYIQMEEDFVIRILYPKTELIALNTAIESWVTDTVSYYQSEANAGSTLNESAELTAEYDSYIVDNQWVSIKITGIFDKPFLAHPIDIIATFHANLKTGDLITLDNLLLAGGREALEQKVIADAKLDAEEVDEHLLDLWALTPDSLEITLERGDYLPMSDGTVTLSYSFAELEDILVLSASSSTEETPDRDHASSQESSTEESPSSETLFPPEGTHSGIIDNSQPALPSAIDPNKPMVALTFDDGPSKHTNRLLDAFAAHGGKGTFFVVGNIIENRTEALKRMVAEGHQIAGHSWDHRQLTKLSSTDLTDQIMNTRAKIYDVTEIDTTMIRPPYGSYNDEVKQVCTDLGIVMVNWSLDTLDWKYKDAGKIYNTIMSDVKDGDIILCHDLHSTTVDAMERVIPALIEKGYQLVTVSELLSYSDKTVSAGNVYNKR